jgi:hypothetical protein
MDELKNSSPEIRKIIENTGYNTKKAILAPPSIHIVWIP